MLFRKLTHCHFQAKDSAVCRQNEKVEFDFGIPMDSQNDAEDDYELLEVKQKTKKPDHWQCYICGFETNIESDVREHVKGKHPSPGRGVWTCGPPRPFQCLKCKHTFVSENSLKLHICGEKSDVIVKQNSDGTRKCGQCDKSFKSKGGLVLHMAKEHGSERQFQCSSCDYKATIPSLLRKHVQRKHSNTEITKEHLCQECGKTFADKDYLQNHIRLKHNKERLTCFSCGLLLSSAMSLIDHLIEVHGRSENRTFDTGYHCETCGLNYGDFVKLRKHLRTEHKFTLAVTKKKKAKQGQKRPPSLPCKYCGKVLSAGACLRYHINKHHENSELYHCPKCPKVFHRPCDLNKHVDYAHENKQGATCGTCGKRFITQHLMLRHVRFVHEKKEQYSCGQCAFQTHSPYILKAHDEQVHQRLRPHKCPFCEASFYYNRDKEKHVNKIHTTISTAISQISDSGTKHIILTTDTPLPQFTLANESDITDQITIIQQI